VGVTPNSIVYDKARKVGKDYLQFLANAITAIHQDECLPVLIPHSYRGDVQRLHNNDRGLCLAVLERLPDGVPCYYVDADLGSAELRAVVGQLHLLVASRFHSMISALATGVPPITFGWGDQKYREVLAEFGVEDLYVPYRGLDTDGFLSRLRDARSRRDELSRRICGALVKVRRESDDVAEQIVAVLHGDSASTSRAPQAPGGSAPAAPQLEGGLDPGALPADSPPVE
jgi:polysaccharide pyruvyl transferase WcaK-like protein